MQRLLQIDNDLTLVPESDGDHAADPLVVNISVALFVDAITTRLDGTQHGFRAIHEFGIGHYNFVMLKTRQILVSAIDLAVCAAALCGCGQPGALYFPTEPAAARRATLPQSLIPGAPADASATANPATPPASAPATK
jgi:predicted small lipoprotein YifL